MCQGLPVTFKMGLHTGPVVAGTGTAPEGKGSGENPMGFFFVAEKSGTIYMFVRITCSMIIYTYISIDKLFTYKYILYTLHIKFMLEHCKVNVCNTYWV